MGGVPFNEDIEKVETNLVQLLDSFDAFEEYFQRVGEKIISLEVEAKQKISHESAFLQAVLVHEEHYLEKKNKSILIKKIESLLASLLHEFRYCYKHWLLLQRDFFQEKQFKVTQTTLKKRSMYIEKLFTQLLDSLVFYEDFTYTNFISHKKSIDSLLKKLSAELQVLGNLAFGEEYFFKDVKFSGMEKLREEDILPGDLLLLKKEDFTLTPYRKALRWLLQSNIMHSAFVFDVVGDEIFVLEANSHDSRQIGIDSLERKKGYTYVVLRPRKPFTKLQIADMKEFSTSFVGKKFSNSKIIIGSLERGIEFLFRHFSFYGRHMNPLRKVEGHFCSEIVASIYDRGGCYLGISKDPSIASPIDLLNSRNVKIVGYIR